jgi:uncharacterized protein (DUF433 family)
MMATPIPDPIPIHRDAHGRLRITNTNVLLDLLIYSFLDGNTPETIIEQYPSLRLKDVYLALGYYLDHREEISVYLRQQEAEAEAGQREDQAHHPAKLTREILLARLEAKRKQSGS